MFHCINGVKCLMCCLCHYTCCPKTKTLAEQLEERLKELD